MATRVGQRAALVTCFCGVRRVFTQSRAAVRGARHTRARERGARARPFSCLSLFEMRLRRSAKTQREVINRPRYLMTRLSMRSLRTVFRVTRLFKGCIGARGGMGDGEIGIINYHSVTGDSHFFIGI